MSTLTSTLDQLEKAADDVAKKASAVERAQDALATAEAAYQTAVERAEALRSDAQRALAAILPPPPNPRVRGG